MLFVFLYLVWIPMFIRCKLDLYSHLYYVHLYNRSKIKSVYKIVKENWLENFIKCFLCNMLFLKDYVNCIHSVKNYSLTLSITSSDFAVPSQIFIYWIRRWSRHLICCSVADDPTTGNPFIYCYWGLVVHNQFHL